MAYFVAEFNASDPTGIAIYLNNGTSNPFAGVVPIRILQGVGVQGFDIGA